MRGRGLVVAGVLLFAVIAAAVLAGHPKSTSGTTSPQRQVSFGAHVQPPAGSDGTVAYNNAWLVSDSETVIAVYAGGQPQHRQNGLFLIQRHKGNEAHPWKTTNVVVHGSGPLTLLRPSPPATEDAALRSTLHFVTANGGTGTLDLSNDRVSINH